MTNSKTRSMFHRRERRRRPANDPAEVFKTFVHVLARLQADARGGAGVASMARERKLSRPPETKRAIVPAAQASLAGIIEGYASIFGVADAGGDIVMPGAFARALARGGARQVKMLWQHNAAEPIGVWTAITEDSKGLKVEGRLDLSVTRAREALSLLRAGAIDGLSIGFRTRRATMDKATGLRRLFEIDLWEISIVTFPMLAVARVDAVKAAPKAPAAGMGAAVGRLRAQRAAARFQYVLQSARPSPPP